MASSLILRSQLWLNTTSLPFSSMSWALVNSQKSKVVAPLVRWQYTSVLIVCSPSPFSMPLSAIV
jgi:hypothetical protein